MLNKLALKTTRRGDSVLLADSPTSYVSALSNTKRLGRIASAVLFQTGATGVLKIKDGNGIEREIDSTKWAQGVWHLVEVSQVLATGTTIANTAFELGWGE